jgi:hypothetical protein
MLPHCMLPDSLAAQRAAAWYLVYLYMRLRLFLSLLRLPPTPLRYENPPLAGQARFSKPMGGWEMGE